MSGAGQDSPDVTSAGIYDFLLGGHNHTAAEMAIGRMLAGHAPELSDAAWANRGFHQRAARWMAEQGVRQFIDIGSGLPTVGNTHEVVQQVSPGARVIYVDRDPRVAVLSEKILAGGSGAAVITGDVRDPDGVLASPALRAMIDFTQPAGLLLTAVLHFVSDSPGPAALVSRYLDALAPGSYLSLSHMTGDHKPPAAVQALLDAGLAAEGGGYLRSADEIRAIFTGLEMVVPYEGAAPDITFAGRWGCEDRALADSDGSFWLYAGVARKP